SFAWAHFQSSFRYDPANSRLGNSRIRKPWEVPREYEGRSGDSDERVEGSDKERAMRTSVRSDLERWGKDFKRVWGGASRVLGSAMHTPYLIAIYLSLLLLIPYDILPLQWLLVAHSLELTQKHPQFI
ncbi:hypothetical protein N7465_009872, partial [Penicillium sp. CMV-2018d]